MDSVQFNRDPHLRSQHDSVVMVSNVVGISDCSDNFILSLGLQPTDMKSLCKASEIILQGHFVPWPTPHNNWLALVIRSEGCTLKVLAQFDGCSVVSCAICCSGESILLTGSSSAVVAAAVVSIPPVVVDDKKTS